MSKQTETARIDAQTAGKTAAAAQEPITYTQTGGKITVTITGAAFANLQAIADAMNATSWCDNDITALDALRLWCGSFIDETAASPGESDIEEVALGVVDILETGEDDDSDADKAKRGELTAQLVAHGVLRSDD